MKIDRDSKKVLGLMSPQRKKEYLQKQFFHIHILFSYFVGLQVIIFLLSIIYPRLFVVCVKFMAPVLLKWYETPHFDEVTAIVTTVILIIPSFEFYDKIAVSLPFRDVYGENISEIRLEDLKELYPEGFDTYRFQYLLHDTLKKEERRIDVIQKLINIFPSGIMKSRMTRETPLSYWLVDTLRWMLLNTWLG